MQIVKVGKVGGFTYDEVGEGGRIAYGAYQYILTYIIMEPYHLYKLILCFAFAGNVMNIYYYLNANANKIVPLRGSIW